MKLPLQNSSKFALVDDDYDGEWLSSFKWRVVNNHPQCFYPYRGSLARMAYGVSLIPRAHVIVHINGDKLDCQTSNLVCLSKSEFVLHFRKQPTKFWSRGNKSGFRGIRVLESGGKEYIYAVCCGKYIKNGNKLTFETFGEAARAYDQKALELWGERAVLNYEESRHVNH